MTKYIIVLFLSIFLINISSSREITYGEAAFSIIEYSNLFSKNISKKIDVNKDEINSLKNPYAKYLTSIGVIFDPIFVELKRSFNLKDASRVVGQIYLIHSGDIDSNEKEIKLPENYESWIEFCNVNGLEPENFLNALKISLQINEQKLNNL